MSHPLDTSVPWPPDDAAPAFDHVQDNWPDRVTARHCLNVVHRADIERAAVPPVVNVTVPGLLGHFTGEAGSGQVAYVPGPAPELTGSFTVVAEALT
jgi:hypothetical protein